jgi:8-oxo-dGTP diphosphatase
MIFHYLVRGVVFVDGQVLLAHQKGADNTFLPGGHIEFGESAEVALSREIEEELGKKAVVKRFIGALEWLWVENGQNNHEINLIFEMTIDGLDAKKPPQSNECHLEFIWSSPAELREHNLLPTPLNECIMKWRNGYRPFWGTFKE